MISKDVWDAAHRVCELLDAPRPDATEYRRLIEEYGYKFAQALLEVADDGT